MSGEHGHEHAKPEKHVEPEVIVKAEATRAAARATFSVVEQSLLNPENTTFTDAQKTELRTASPDKLQPVLEAANEVSLESRHEYDQHDTRDIDVRIKEWSDKFMNGIHHFTDKEHVAEGKVESRIQALASVGIDAHADHHALAEQVEAFRQNYVAEDSSDIGQFVKDLAEGCKEGGKINLDTLAQRLSDIEPMLGIFGKVKSADKLVADFAMAYGILSQSGSKKEEWIDKAAAQIKNKPLPDEHTRLKAVWDKIVENDLKDIPEHEPPTPQKEAPKSAEEQAQLRSAIESELERPLTPDEVKVIQDGGGEDEVYDHIYGKVYQDVVKMDQAFRRGETPDENRSPEEQDTVVIADSIFEMNAVLQTLQLGTDDEKNQVLEQLKQKFDAERAKGNNPAYMLTFIKDPSNGDKLRAIYDVYLKGTPPPDQSDPGDPPPAPPEKKPTYQPSEDKLNMTQEASQHGESGAAFSIKHEKGGDKKREDRIVFMPENHAFAALDGVGGHDNADIAAQFAQDYLREAVQFIPDGIGLKGTEKYLQRLVIELNNAVREKTHGQTTLSFGYVFEDSDGTKKLITVNVGDSRMYRLRNGQLEALTTDDYNPRYPRDAQMARQKKFSEIDTADDYRALPDTERWSFLRRNEIDQALGSSIVEPDITVHDLVEGDIILGTTDGVHDNLTDTQIQAILNANPNPQEAIQKLIIAARDRARGPKSGEDRDIRAKLDDISGFIMKIDQDFPPKKPAKSAGDITDPTSPWAENQGTLVWNFQKLAQAERKLGRDMTAIEQFYFFNGQPMDKLDAVEPVYREWRRARKNRLEHGAYENLTQKMEQYENAGDTDNDDYKRARAIVLGGEFQLNNRDEVEVFSFFNGDSEDEKNKLLQFFDRIEAAKGDDGEPVLIVSYRKNKDDVTIPHVNFSYVKANQTQAAAA